MTERSQDPLVILSEQMAALYGLEPSPVRDTNADVWEHPRAETVEQRALRVILDRTIPGGTDVFAGALWSGPQAVISRDEDSGQLKVSVHRRWTQAAALVWVNAALQLSLRLARERNEHAALALNLSATANRLGYALSERDTARAQAENMKRKYDALQAKYEKLSRETTDG